MATISAVILKKQKKLDGTWNVKIRISNNGRSSYIETTIFATKSNLDTKLRLKKVFVDTYLTSLVNEYRERINKLGVKVEYMDAIEIRTYLQSDEKEINFLEFCDSYIKDLLDSSRESTGIKRQSSINVFKSFLGKKSIRPEQITLNLIKELEIYLRKKKYAVNTMRNILSDLSVIFNAAKYKYNDEELGIIKIHNSPFSRYSMPKKTESKKKALDIQFIKDFRDYHFTSKTTQDSRDLFMLSFYMCGTNMVDFHRYLTDPNIERFDYNRSKTKNKREDQSFISIKVVDEAKPLIEKFAGKLQRRFASQKTMNNMVSKAFSIDMEGLFEVEDLTFYHARHSFATLARRCGFSLEDVGAALNHKKKTVTDDYIKEDWSLIDKIQRTVLDLLK